MSLFDVSIVEVDILSVILKFRIISRLESAEDEINVTNHTVCLKSDL